MNTIIRFFLNTLVLMFAFIVGQRILSGIVVDTLTAAFWAAVVLGLANAIVKPVLMLFSLPIRFVTFGLFTFVINAFMIMIAAYLVDGFSATFISALLLSLLLSVVNIITDKILK